MMKKRLTDGRMCKTVVDVDNRQMNHCQGQFEIRPSPELSDIRARTEKSIVGKRDVKQVIEIVDNP